MVNIVINKEKKRVKANDIDKGIIISKEYYCICCDSRMIYVKGSEYDDKYGNKITRESHFKHKNSMIENECKNKKYNGYTKKDMENEYNNEKSDFHKYWQDMFNTDNLEHKIMENNKIHYADIYIECDDKIDLKINNNLEQVMGESILSNYLPNKLVIEIQHSRISNEKMIERTNFYHKDDINREIIWIFDLQKKVKKIEKIITYNETKYRLKLMNQNEHDFQELFKITDYKPIVILDNSGNMLYYIKDIPKFDSDYLDVIGIRRDDFLSQLSKYVNKELIYNGEIVKDTVKIIDYESAVINLKNVDEENKNKLRYIFYIIEYISYNELMLPENFNSEFINNIYMYLMFYSKKSEKVRSMFKIFLERNRRVYKNKLNFGKECGKEMNEISFNYLYWVFKEFKLDNIISYYKEYDDIDDGIAGNNLDDWKINKICSNVDLYENIYNYIKENIEYYNDLKYEDYNIDEEDLNIYEYLEHNLCLVEKKIYEKKYKNLLLPINNDINEIYEKHLFIKSVCNDMDDICNFCKRDGYNKYNLNICGICECKSKGELIDMLKDTNQEKYIKEREERIKIENEKRIKMVEEKKKMEEEKKKMEEENKKMEEILNREKKERILMYNEEMYEKDRLNKIIKEEKKKIEEEKNKIEDMLNKERILMYKEEMYERDRLNKIKREEEIKKEMEELKERMKKKNDYDDWIKEEKRRKEEKLYKFNVIHYYQHNISGRINPVQQRLKKCKSLKECMIYLESKIVHEDIKEHIIKKIEIKVYSKVMYKFNNVEDCDEWLMSGNTKENKELDIFVREKLGESFKIDCDQNQIEFENIVDRREHKRLDFDGCNENNIINNKELINLFSEYYNDKGVIIQSRKGSLKYYIVEKENSENDKNWYYEEDDENSIFEYIKCKRIDGGEMGTVDIIKDIIYEINKI